MTKLERLIKKADEKNLLSRQLEMVLCDSLEEVEQLTEEYDRRFGEGNWSCTFVYGAEDLQDENDKKTAYIGAQIAPGSPGEIDSIKLFTDHKTALKKAARARQLGRKGDATGYAAEAAGLMYEIEKNGLLEVYKAWESTV